VCEVVIGAVKKKRHRTD